MKRFKISTGGFVTVCSIAIVIILVLTTLWLGQSTRKDTDGLIYTSVGTQ